MRQAADNISDFQHESIVFDRRLSNVRTQAGHLISFVFPTWIGQKEDEFNTVIINGVVVSLSFELGKENDNPQFPGHFEIHGEKFNLPEEVKQMHEQGIASLKRFKAGKVKTIVGADIPSKPKVLYLSSVRVKLDTKLKPVAEKAQLDCFEELLAKVNDMTSRDIKMTVEHSHIILEIPATWVLQDITAITKATNKNAATALPKIKYPVAFPSLRSRLVLARNEIAATYIIEDFDIVPGDKPDTDKVEVLLVDPNDRTNNHYLSYSCVYAETQAKMLHPLIIRVLPVDGSDASCDSHRTFAQDYIQKNLSKWGLWKICDGKKGFKIMTEPLEKGGKPAWMTVSDAIEAEDHRIISFESGTAVINDRVEHIYHPFKDHDEGINLLDIPPEASITSLIFNAVIGNAESRSGNKTVELYFAAKNGYEIDLNKLPLFAPMPYPGRPVVDVVNDEWFLGTAGKSAEKKHAEKTVLRWVSITTAFRNFYLWAVSSGKNPLFKGKTSQEIREMVECRRFPQLVEMFNLMVFGLTSQNPTRRSKWSSWFAASVLGVDPATIA